MNATEVKESLELEHWCAASFAERRRALARALSAALEGAPGVQEVRIESGAPGREYDLTAAVQTDVGVLRTPLWSHARATIFCDESVHHANRDQLSPALAVQEAARRLRPRLSVPFILESRGLTLSLQPEPGVQRTWTAEHSLFRKRTSVIREDRVDRPGEVDVRDLLAHFYTGPSLRAVGVDGEAFLVPEGSEVEGPIISLCSSCAHWHEGPHPTCPDCGAPADAVIAARALRR